MFYEHADRSTFIYSCHTLCGPGSVPNFMPLRPATVLLVAQMDCAKITFRVSLWAACASSATVSALRGLVWMYMTPIWDPGSMLSMNFKEGEWCSP